MIGQLRLVVAFLLIALAWAFPAFSENPPLAEPSWCVPLDLASSGTEVPYNLRAIDGTFLAGGSLFDPVAHSRQEDQVRTELRFLKEHGVKTVIMLEVPVSINLDRLTEERICREEGLRLLEIRMTSEEVPSASQTSAILSAVRQGAYVHCRWGADRTGAVIARYLREVKHFSGLAAFRAIISGGSHSGIRGGFKFKPYNRKLLLYFWPEVSEESLETCAIYGIPFTKKTDSK